MSLPDDAPTQPPPHSARQVVHLIPFDAVGGVEVAATSIRHLKEPGFNFDVKVLFPGALNRAVKLRSFNPISYLKAALELSRPAPDVLIVSLWRAALVGILCKLVNPRLKLVAFLHLTKNVHFVDKWATHAAVRLADEVWSDSLTTIDRRVPGLPASRKTVISFIPRKFEPVTRRTPGPNFVYWGRIARQKNLLRAITIFASVHRRLPDARFSLLGPDGGELAGLKRRCAELGIADHVSFEGPKSQADLPAYAQEASFFILTSDFEGMALAVVEAMQMGLVPVVTPVGEVGKYCKDGVNAIVIDADERAADELVNLIGLPERYEQMHDQAIGTWTNKPTYRESVISACNVLMWKR